VRIRVSFVSRFMSDADDGFRREDHMRFIAAGMLCLLAGPCFAASKPALLGCVYAKDVPQQAIAEKIMGLALPYLDNQFIYYRDDSGQLLGSYAVRRSLRVYFYDKYDIPMGTAIRRSQELTSYFDPDGNYLGNCINHKLVAPDQRPVHFDPGAQ
jgi:hypothetical protein